VSSTVLENAKFLWLAKEIYIWGLGNRRLIEENISWRWFYDEWGFIAGDHMYHIVANYSKLLAPENLGDWKILGSIPLAPGELKARICRPTRDKLLRFRYVEVLKRLGDNSGVELKLEFKDKRESLNGVYDVDEIVFLGEERFWDKLSATPRLFLAIKIGDRYLVHGLYGLWVDLVGGREYAVHLKGLFWPTIDQIRNIKPLGTAGEKEYTFYSESREKVTLIVGSREIKLLVEGEEKSSNVRVGGLLRPELLGGLKEFVARLNDISYANAVARAFKTLSSIVGPELVYVLAFFLRYNHIDEHRIWFFPIKRLEDFDKYLRYARRLRAKYDLLKGRGPTWRANIESLKKLIEKNKYHLLTTWLGNPAYARYLEVLARGINDIKSIARVLNISSTRVRQVMRDLAKFGFTLRKQNRWIVNKDRVLMYTEKFIRLLREGIDRPEVLDFGLACDWVLNILQKLHDSGLALIVPIMDLAGVMGLDLEIGNPIAFRISGLSLQTLYQVGGIETDTADVLIRAALQWNLFTTSLTRRYLLSEGLPVELVGLYDYVSLRRASIWGEIYLGSIDLGRNDVWWRRARSILLR